MKSLCSTFSSSLRLLGAAALLALVAGGCSHQPTRPVRLATDVPPSPSTPEDAVRLLGWCWEHRSLADYRTIFTDDYRFAFSVSDSCASAFPAGFTRDDELEAARRIFVSGASGLPPAKQIRLVFLDDLSALDDSRPGKTPMVHKEILTRVDLSLDFSDGSGSRSLESVRFFLARRDSAEVPKEIRASAPRADTSRWYVERWEEEAPVVTSQISGGARLGPATALPTRPISWGYLKWVYLARPAAPSAETVSFAFPAPVSPPRAFPASWRP